MMMITSKTSNECCRSTPCRWGGKTTLTAFNVRTDWRQFQRADTTSSEHHHRRRKKIEEEEEKKISRSFTVDALSTRARVHSVRSVSFFGNWWWFWCWWTFCLFLSLFLFLSSVLLILIASHWQTAAADASHCMTTFDGLTDDPDETKKVDDDHDRYIYNAYIL